MAALSFLAGEVQLRCRRTAPHASPIGFEGGGEFVGGSAQLVEGAGAGAEFGELAAGVAAVPNAFEAFKRFLGTEVRLSSTGKSLMHFPSLVVEFSGPSFVELLLQLMKGAQSGVELSRVRPAEPSEILVSLRPSKRFMGAQICLANAAEQLGQRLLRGCCELPFGSRLSTLGALLAQRFHRLPLDGALFVSASQMVAVLPTTLVRFEDGGCRGL